MRVNVRGVGVLTVAVLAIGAGGLVLAGDAPALTPAARTSVEALHPAGEIVAVGHEREGGAAYFEVVVWEGARTFEIEVAPDGAVGEIETLVTLEDLPQQVRRQVAEATGGARLRAIERHEVRGIPGNGTFMPLDRPIVTYEVGYEVDGARRETIVAPDGMPPGMEDESDDDDDAEGDDDEKKEKRVDA